MLRLCLVGAFTLGLGLSQGASAAVWHMRPAQSSINITAIQQGGDFGAQFKAFSAEINFDPADLAHSSVIATINMASWSSNSTDSDNPKDGAPSELWFNVPKFPVARFATKSFRDLGGGKYEAVADLTIRDVTKQVTLPFTLKIDGNVAHMTGSLNVQRGDFGVGQGGWASSDWVGQPVKIAIDLVADKTN